MILGMKIFLKLNKRFLNFVNGFKLGNRVGSILITIHVLLFLIYISA